MKNNVAIILARGGSKGIPRKNLKNFCGKPLIAWSIEQAKTAKNISSVWLSSDDEKILSLGRKYGIEVVKRPKSLCGNFSTAEDGYLHAINKIQKNKKKIDLVIGLQATSPIRESLDIDNAIKKFYKFNYDSMISASPIGDFFIWGKNKKGIWNSINYDHMHRPRRQEFPEQYEENGSFYMFKPEILLKYNNRLGGKIGISEMEYWKHFEIDEPEDIFLCEVIMKNFLLKRRK
jgi:CMP-N,N'-diacetyllegionaminic acid synthase